MSNTVNLPFSPEDIQNEWRCAGCGILSPGRARKCECPTSVVVKNGEPSAWKVEEKPKYQDELIGDITRDICELPDRTSPDDEPDLLLVTIQELDIILRRHLFGEE